MMSSLNQAVCLLDMSLMAAKHVLHDSPEPLQHRLAWLAGELERLAGEAYRLADEAGDDPGPNPGHSCHDSDPAWCDGCHAESKD